MADLREAFHLSPAEDRVARRLLAGARPSIIAVDLGVSEPTIRCQLRAVFKKSGADCQAAFIRRVAMLDGWNPSQYATPLNPNSQLRDGE